MKLDYNHVFTDNVCSMQIEEDKLKPFLREAEAIAMYEVDFIFFMFILVCVIKYIIYYKKMLSVKR